VLEVGKRQTGIMDLEGLDIAGSVLDLVGDTPLVRLSRLDKGLPCPVVAKMETTNPGGSSKDRPAIAMINAAEEAGLLKPGGTIIEPTSGNTGVGLAIVAAQRGYKCIFVVTDKLSPEKITLLEAYGAEVVVCPVAVAPDDPRSYYSTAERLVKEIPNAYRPNQYENLFNPKAHYESTGPEIWKQTKGKITHFVAGAGTGGTISGVGAYLKEQNPNIKVIAADPSNSVYSGGSGRPYLVEGVGEDFWPGTYDPKVVDETIPVTDAESFEMARQVTQQEGLLIGGSGGTAVFAAMQVAKNLSSDDLMIFDKNWMSKMGFSKSDGVTVKQLLKHRNSKLPELIYAKPWETVGSAIETMQKYGLSCLPVAKGDMPLAAAEVIGSVSADQLMTETFESSGDRHQLLEGIMIDPLPVLGIGQSIDEAVSVLSETEAALVHNEGLPFAVLTKTDVMDFISTQFTSEVEA
jgi:cystathionine beta-synthase